MISRSPLEGRARRQWTDTDLAEAFGYISIAIHVNFLVHFSEVQIGVSGSLNRIWRRRG